MSSSEQVRDASVAETVRSIHATPGKICLVVTGAGTQALAWLFAEAGTSRTILDAQVPYSMPALNEFTAHSAEQHVSADEAQLMAERALARAKSLAQQADEPRDMLLAGVSCTAAIATDRARRGENRAHVAFAANDGRTAVMSLVMEKGARDRAGEEKVVSSIVLNTVAEAKHVGLRLPLELTGAEHVDRRAPDEGSSSP